MKIDHPTPQIQPRDSHGGPKGPAQAGTGGTTATGGTTTTDPAFNVDLSADAKGVIAAGKGDSANSPAQQAREYFTSFSATEDFKNFGQLVSQIARGIYSTEPAVVDEPPVVEEPVAEEPVIVVDEPIVTVDEPVVNDAELIDALTTDTTETV